MVCGFSSAGTFAYIASAPFVFISLYKVSTAQFGWLFGAVAVGMVVCSQINGRMPRTIPLWKVLRVANLVQLGAGILLLITVLTGIGRAARGFCWGIDLCFGARLRVPQRLGDRDDAAR